MIRQSKRGARLKGNGHAQEDLSHALGKVVQSPIHSPRIGICTFFPFRYSTSKGASQYLLALEYFSMIFDQPPLPTFMPSSSRGMPSRFDSHWIRPTGKPCTEKMSSDFSAIVS